MARWKKATGSGDEAVNAKLRRHYKEKAKREKLLRQKPAGLKEKLISIGCAVFLTGAVVFAAVVVWQLIKAKWLDQ